jgi:hypothetical protein
MFLFFRTVLMWKGLEKYYMNAAVVVAFIIPTLSVIIVGSLGGFGYPGSLPWCIYSTTTNQVGSTINTVSSLYFFIVGAIFDIVSLVFMVAVIVNYVIWLSVTSRKLKAVIEVEVEAEVEEGRNCQQAIDVESTTGANATTEADKTMTITKKKHNKATTATQNRTSWLHTRASLFAMAKAVGPMNLFHIALIMCAFSVLVYPITWILFASKNEVLTVEWVDCLFSQFYHRHSPPVEEVWKDKCGETSSIINRHGYSTSYWVMFCLSGQSLIISVVLLFGRVLKWCEKPKVHQDIVRYEAWKQRMLSLIKLSTDQHKQRQHSQHSMLQENGDMQQRQHQRQQRRQLLLQLKLKYQQQQQRQQLMLQLKLKSPSSAILNVFQLKNHRRIQPVPNTVKKQNEEDINGDANEHMAHFADARQPFAPLDLEMEMAGKSSQSDEMDFSNSQKWSQLAPLSARVVAVEDNVDGHVSLGPLPPNHIQMLSST